MGGCGEVSQTVGSRDQGSDSINRNGVVAGVPQRTVASGKRGGCTVQPDRTVPWYGESRVICRRGGMVQQPHSRGGMGVGRRSSGGSVRCSRVCMFIALLPRDFIRWCVVHLFRVCRRAFRQAHIQSRMGIGRRPSGSSVRCSRIRVLIVSLTYAFIPWCVVCLYMVCGKAFIPRSC